MTSDSVAALGWALACMGVFFGALATLSLLGLFRLTIEIMDVVVVGRRARWIFVASCAVIAIVGVGIIRKSRRVPR